MSEPKRDSLETLIHDVNSKCASLRSAVALLRAASPEEFKELLSLMTQQARGLADQLTAFGREGGK